MKYKIVIEFEADYVPSDIMNDLVDQCAVQVESLNDGTMVKDDGQNVDIDYKIHQLSWSNV